MQAAQNETRHLQQIADGVLLCENTLGYGFITFWL